MGFSVAPDMSAASPHMYELGITRRFRWITEGRMRLLGGVDMALSILWTGMVVISLLCAAATGRLELLAGAALEGASTAVELCLGMAGAICLWTGVMEVMRRGGLMDLLSRALRPALGVLFPAFRRDEAVMGPLAANVSANLLGLGNAATPMGIKAAAAMRRDGDGEAASDELCMLVVCNSASIQLIPATVAGVRAAAGAGAPFDILPAVWIASAISVGTGIAAAKLFSRLGGRTRRARHRGVGSDHGLDRRRRG